MVKRPGMSARLLLMFSIVAARVATAAEPLPENSPPLRYEKPKVLAGKIYAQGSDRSQPLFTFKRTATREGARLNVLREYNYPDGKAAARERVVYEGDQLRSYELEELQIGANGKATLQPSPGASAAGTIRFEYTQKRTATATEALRKDTLIADMVGPFLSSQWDRLLRGEEVKCRYIVVPRKETVGFAFVKTRQEIRRGKEVLIVKMEPSSAILSTLVDPLFFVIEKDGRHRVLEYSGRTTPKWGKDNKWRNLDAVTVFEWD